MKKLIILFLYVLLLSSCTPKTVEETTTASETSAVTETSETVFGADLQPIYTKDAEIKEDTPDFTPVEKTREISYGNLPCNISGFIQTGFICPDNENNILYFTDVGNTNSICKLQNGRITELVKQAGSYLNLWDGWLYYICDSENPAGFGEYLSPSSGDIWRYNLTTGEKELFYETCAYTLMVSDYGIDFTAGYPRTIDYEGNEATVYETALYRIDFDGENLCKIMDGGENAVYYGENILINHNGYKSFYNTENGAYTDILPRKNTGTVSQNGDWLTYIGGKALTSIHALNVRTGETRFFEDKAHFQYIYGYVWIDNVLYASVDGGIVKITADGGVYTEIRGEDIYQTVTAGSFMTDGKNLYGVTGDFMLYRYDYDKAQGVYKANKITAVDSGTKTDENAWLFKVNENVSNTDNSINLKNYISRGRVCYIEETDTLFWSDNTGLYMTSGDTTARLTDMSAMCINVLCGRVYFINSRINSELAHDDSGKAYYIDLKTGECRLFIDESISQLSVSGEALIYVKQEKVIYEGREATMNYSLRCDTDGKNHQKTPYKYLISDENFSAGSDAEKGVRVYSIKTDEEILFAEDKGNTDFISLYENQLLFYGKGDKEFGVIKRIDLKTGEETEYYFPDSYVWDYAFFGDKFCYCDGNFFVITDSSGTASYYRQYKNGASIKAIYSGGGHIYASRTDGKIVRLGFKEDILQNEVTEEVLSYEEN